MTRFNWLARLVGLPLCLVLSAGTWSCSPGESRPAAELVLFSSSIYTSDLAQPLVEGFAIRDAKFVAVGSRSEVEAFIGRGTEVIDLGDRSVLPGLNDGHVHLESGFSLVRGINLYGIADREVWLQKVEARIKELPEGSWIVGGRWDHTLAPEGVLPNRQELDKVAPRNPVALVDVDGHSLWANSLALELAGVKTTTPDPEGGRILRSSGSQEPTGILFETAMGLVFEKIPPMSDDERLEVLQQTIAYANGLGITGVHNMASSAGDYVRLAEEGRLPLRVWFGLTGVPATGMQEAVRTREEVARKVEAALPRGTYGPRLEIGYLKYMIDGVLSTRTAAMIEDYADAPGERGLPRHSQEELNGLIQTANEAGFPAAVHAIGDLGVRMSLNAFESAGRNPALLPNRIEHIEVINKEELSRFRELGVLASMNPHHCITGIDVYNVDRVGESRAPLSFAWGAIQGSGATLVFGSDWATAPLNPLHQLYAAVVREKPAGGPEGGWYPENALSFSNALFAYTQSPANAAGWGEEVGSISVGKWADFAVLDGRIPEPFDRSVLERRVVATYLGGIRVFSMEEAQATERPGTSSPEE